MKGGLGIIIGKLGGCTPSTGDGRCCSCCGVKSSLLPLFASPPAPWTGVPLNFAETGDCGVGEGRLSL